MGLKRVNIEGQKFYQLTAVKFSHMNNKHQSMWLFRCDCGVEKVLPASQVMGGGTKSCGCRTHSTHPGYNKLPDGESGFNSLFYDYKYHANRRGLKFSLSEKTFRELTKSLCYYCGSPPLQESNTSHAVTPYLYNGIDRIDSDLGYVKGNVVASCKFCNYAKLDRSTKEFTNWLKRLVDFQNSKRDAKSIRKN
jgi:hypothetical protein